MKEYTNPLERISVILACLLTNKEKEEEDAPGFRLTTLSEATGIPASLIREDIIALSAHPFFSESITISDNMSTSADDIFIDIDPDMFRYGYADEQVVLMLSADERKMLLSEKNHSNNRNKTADSNASGALHQPFKARIKITDASGTIIKKIRTASDAFSDMVLIPSDTEPHVWLLEDVVTDKTDFIRNILPYGTAIRILEPESLIEEYTGILKSIKNKFEDAGV